MRGLIAIAAVAAAAPAAVGQGDAVIRGRAGPSDIVVTTTRRTAGAIHSLTWNGKEFLDSTDHGRQWQSACAFDGGAPGPFVAEAYNPTEAGSRRDGAGAKSSSQLLYLKADARQLVTVTRLAFWLAPGEKSGQFPARNTRPLSDHLLTKHVTVGAKGLAHAVEYAATFTVPPGEAHAYGQFEAATGYMPADFDTFLTFDPATGQLAPLSDGPGEQALPVVLSTADGRYAMGVWSPDQPSKGFEAVGYGRFRFPADKVVKWNCVFRVRAAPGQTLKAGQYPFRVYVAVGSRQNVRDTLAALAAGR